MSLMCKIILEQGHYLSNGNAELYTNNRKDPVIFFRCTKFVARLSLSSLNFIVRILRGFF